MKGWMKCAAVGTLWACGNLQAWALEEPALRDSMLSWLERGDRAAWTAACAKDPAAAAVLASWGLEGLQAPTDTEWQWMQLGASQLATVELELDRNPVRPEAYIARRTAREARPWAWATFALGLAAAGAGCWWWLERRRLRAAAREAARTPEERALAGYAAASRTRRVPFPEAAWQAFLAEEEPGPVSPRWGLLTNTERECARLLSKGTSVTDIAVELACSPSYVYNLRSSIRKKWKLADHVDVVDAILAELKEAG